MKQRGNKSPSPTKRASHRKAKQPKFEEIYASRSIGSQIERPSSVRKRKQMTSTEFKCAFNMSSFQDLFADCGPLTTNTAETSSLDTDMLGKQLEGIELVAKRESKKLEDLKQLDSSATLNREELKLQIEESATRLEKLDIMRKCLSRQSPEDKKSSSKRRPLSAKGRITCHQRQTPVKMARSRRYNKESDPQPSKKRPKLRHAAVVRAIAESTANDLVRTSLVRATIRAHQH